MPPLSERHYQPSIAFSTQWNFGSSVDITFSATTIVSGLRCHHFLGLFTTFGTSISFGVSILLSNFNTNSVSNTKRTKYLAISLPLSSVRFRSYLTLTFSSGISKYFTIHPLINSGLVKEQCRNNLQSVARKLPANTIFSCIL